MQERRASTTIPERDSNIRVKRVVLPLLLSIALAVVTGVESVTDSHGRPAPHSATPELSASYIALSPVSRTFDSLSLLSTGQSIALFVSVALLVAAVISFSRSANRRPRWKRLAIALSVMIVGIAVTEAGVVFLPRPMASLIVPDADVVVIDFHSHTGASHDVRKSFTADRNREWHRSGGFDIAYVSDHVTFDGVVSAQAGNPALAGNGTSLLSAVEGRYHRIMSTIMLGLTQPDTALLNRRGNLLPGILASGRSPVTIIALPNRNLDSLNASVRDSLTGLSAIELIDAAPRGLSQLDREEEKIRDIAAKLRLLLVSASNNHGWGRAVAGWNLMRIPGWRTLPPDSVGRIIEQQLLEGRSDAVEIVMRKRPRLHGLALAGILPVFSYQVIGTLTLPERLTWLAWIWGITGLVFGFRRKESSA